MISLVRNWWSPTATDPESTLFSFRFEYALLSIFSKLYL